MKLTATPATTVIWCGTVKECLTDVEKAILFHEHEAKRNRFFGMMKQEEYHTYMVGAIKRMQAYSNSTMEPFREALRRSLEVKGVEVKGSVKEERIEHMKQIFKDNS